MRVGEFDIEVQRKWIRSIRLVVRRDGSVRMSAPVMTAPSTLYRFAEERLDWIRKAVAKMDERPRRVLREISKEQAQALADYLSVAVPMWCERMGEEPVQIRLRNMKSMWGNCRWRERVVTLNLQLALVPHELVDYIIVHELAHLKVQNHSAAFHARVQLFIPDEKERRRRLNAISKTNSAAC